MGVWGTQNFANDEAMDCVHELMDEMLADIEEIAASEHGMEPDEPDGFRMICKIDLLTLIGNHTGASMPDQQRIVEWKEKFLNVWDQNIDELNAEDSFKASRRKVITETFDGLIDLCKR